jgi:hypothetical protein
MTTDLKSVVASAARVMLPRDAPITCAWQRHANVAGFACEFALGDGFYIDRAEKPCVGWTL